jgi:hypothetical protein
MEQRERVRDGLRGARRSLLRVLLPFRGTWPRVADAAVGVLGLLVVALAVSTYSTTLARQASEWLSGNKYLALLNGLANPFRTQHLLLESGLPVYDLVVKKSEYAKIEGAIEEARKRGWMSDDQKVWARGKFLAGGHRYDVKVRVRGDLSPHWKDPKKSWRIKFGKAKVERDGAIVKEPIPFEGKEQINLIIPSDRDYVLAYFVNDLLREQGLVVPRDRFVVLRINGAVQGLYYEVEHFDKPLLAAHRRPETSVFGQNDRPMHFEQYTKYGTPVAADARFDVGGLRRLVDREGDLGLRAMQVLIDHSLHPSPENFRRARAVLDWERYLRFRVITTLLNTNHVRFGSDNLRLFYDESRGLLEPIPWDAHVTRMPVEPGTIDFWNSHGPDELQRATLLDPELRRRRNQLLWELVADGGDALLSRYDRIHDRIRPLAWADVLTTPVQGHKMDERRSELAFNVHRVHKVLSTSSGNLTYRLEAADRARLDFVSTNFSGIRVDSIELADPVLDGAYRLYADADLDGELGAGDPLVAEAQASGGALHLALGRDVLPELEYGGDELDGRYWEYFDTLSGRARWFLVGRVAPERRDPLVWMPPRIRVASANAVTGAPIPSGVIEVDELAPEHSVGILAYDASDPWDLEAQDLDLAGFLARHPEFRASTDEPGAAELTGSVTLGGTVSVPRSVPLVLRPGLDLTLGPRANVVAYGGLTALGTEQAPIRIHGDGVETWGVFGVVRPPREVHLAHVEIRDGNQGQVNGILFTGGFAVHNGDLRAEHVRVLDMQSEDGVNVKNGRIWMRHCLIAGGASDAMDLDFVSGEVRDSLFLHNAGDGLDLSGATVVVAGNRFEGMGDKGISVGEDSHPVIVNNLLRGNVIGISTKDLSHPRVAWTTFVDNETAIEAKRKKPMFGGGSGEFVNVVFSGNRVLLTEDSFSKGGVQIAAALSDQPLAECAGCRTTSVRFAGDGADDWRLASETNGGGPAPLLRDWAEVEQEIDGSLPPHPGVFRVPLATERNGG